LAVPQSITGQGGAAWRSAPGRGVPRRT